MKDQLCPCDEYRRHRRRDAARGRRSVVSVKGTEAGHLAFNVAYTTVPTTVVAIYECGGTPDGTAEASAEIWREVLECLGAL